MRDEPKPTIILITRQAHTLQQFVDQAHALGVHEHCHIEGRTLSRLISHPVERAALAVVSGAALQEEARAYLPVGTRFILAERSLDYGRLRDMLELPRAGTILLVSDKEGQARQAIAMIEVLGLPLTLVPYWPGAPLPDKVDAALTFGEARHVPIGISPVLDMGSRSIDIATWIEIYNALSVERSEIIRLTLRFIRGIIRIASQLSDEMDRSAALGEHLRTIIDTIEDGVLSLDDRERIYTINRQALDILHRNGTGGVGRPAAEHLPEELNTWLERSGEDAQDIVQILGSSIFVRKVSIAHSGQLRGTLIVLRRAADVHRKEYEYRRRLRDAGHIARHEFSSLVGRSSAMKQLVFKAQQMAHSDGTILILGETGTGKELLAQAIHNASRRRDEPFVGVNFAALSETLLESELFGYEEGAFTGARKGGRVGLFEQAHKGTIFLDEIADASPGIQNRLLRVLQEKQVIRVGGQGVIPVDFRVIAATNRNLRDMVDQGLFRADLYYRLRVLPLVIAPLRQRPEDLETLLEALIERACRRLKRSIFRLSPDAIATLRRHNWPGNVRELENVVDYLAHIASSEVDAQPINELFDDRAFGAGAIQTLAVDAIGTLRKRHERQGMDGDASAVLAILAEAEQALGRQAIVESLQRRGRALSEQQVRLRLRLLAEDGLVTIGRSRQGSTITAAGREYLSKYQSPDGERT